MNTIAQVHNVKLQKSIDQLLAISQRSEHENTRLEVLRDMQARQISEGKNEENKEEGEKLTRKFKDITSLDYADTDSGNGELLAALYGEIFRYDRLRKRWLLWNGTIWNAELDEVAIKILAKNTARKRQIDVASSELPHEIKKKRTYFAITSESEQKKMAMISSVRGEDPVKDDGSGWDANRWLMGASNGIIDLRTGKLREGRQTDKITMRTPIPYIPEAICPRFEEYLLEVLPDRDDVIRFLLKALGYSLTGDMSEQAVFVAYGDPGCGKSKLFEIIRYVMGGYSKESKENTFFDVYNRSNDFELPGLENKRLVTIAEQKSKKFDVGRILKVSGGEDLTAAAKHKNEITFSPHMKLWFYFNESPKLDSSNEPMFQRLRMIHFSQKFRGTDRDDKTLAEKLKKESEGILALLVRYCLLWQKEGLKIPEEIQKNTTEYQIDNDGLGDFLEQRTTEAKTPDEWIQSSVLYEKYKQWSKDNRSKTISIKFFGMAMRKRFLNFNDRYNVTYYPIRLIIGY